MKQGKLDEAVACYLRTLELKPNLAEAHNNLGSALKDLGEPDEAVACFRRALQLNSSLTEAHNNLGNALKEQGELEEAVACYRRALALKPDLAEAHNNLGTALKDQGKLDEAVVCHRRALELKPDSAQAHSNLLLALHYEAGVTLASLAEAHAEYDRRHGDCPHFRERGDVALHETLRRRENGTVPLGPAPSRDAIMPHRNGQVRGERLRLGFVSADLGRHPVGYFLVRVLENLGREGMETVCYSNRILKDELTHRIQSAATGWHDVMGISDEGLAEQIRADGIDILFDLGGHTARNRLLVFARKPAPIQITWIGYEGTTGLGTMDYLLADRHVAPEGIEDYFRERVLRMPDGYLCYEPPAAAPAVGPLPSLKRGYTTFGSFNNPAKITAEVVSVWAEILRRRARARLVLKYRGLGDAAVRGRYLELFAAEGVEDERLELLPSSSYAEYLAAYHQVDVALDPFPFSGSVTTCEALWMGVPVVTCPGETFASRHTLSHLWNVGLRETIARDRNEYVELAVSLGGDLPRLGALRGSLRERMASSPLCNGKRFAANLRNVLRDVWRQHRNAETTPPRDRNAGRWIGTEQAKEKAPAKPPASLSSVTRTVLDGCDSAVTTNPEALAIAIAHHRSGRLQVTEQIYRQSLAVEPNHPDAHYNLGIALAEQGKLDEAIACWRRAVALKPDYAEAHGNLGVALKEQGRVNEAAACYRRALELKPDFAEAHHNLGVVFKEQGKLDEAIACYRRALGLKSDFVAAYHNLGVALKELGRLDEAAACWRRVLELRPDHAEAHGNLGVVLKEQGKLDEAVVCCRRALELKPNLAEAHHNLGVLFMGRGKLDEAVACYRRALELKPDCAEAHHNLGVALMDLGNPQEAALCYRRTLELRPDFVEAHHDLGDALKEQGKLNEAVACYLHTLELQPNLAEAHNNLGNARKGAGKVWRSRCLLPPSVGTDAKSH